MTDGNAIGTRRGILADAHSAILPSPISVVSIQTNADITVTFQAVTSPGAKGNVVVPIGSIARPASHCHITLAGNVLTSLGADGDIIYLIVGCNSICTNACFLTDRNIVCSGRHGIFT
ncbi:hypothetical protein LCW13_11245 [Cobetia amphilecti]|uniref:hypothetical protein n=1 Tax=Cobetia amphilecti TaxID=1055104 RepID=UPI001CDB025B|nr:hypothetical protein [Cobetia amphilecti]UBU50522.1 hypothetical protein LCW13_11245 [Cobetia amphilecti]